MEENIEHRFVIIENKVEHLVKEKAQLNSELDRVKGENQVLKNALQSYEGQIREMDEQIKMLRTASSIKNNKSDNKAVKLKINELIREIDQCIALVTK